MVELYEKIYKRDPTRDLDSEEFFLESIPKMVSKEMNKNQVSPPSVDEIRGVSSPSPLIRLLTWMDSRLASINFSRR